MTAVYETRRWIPVDAPLTNAPGSRSPEALRAVVAQLDVVRNPRYMRIVGGSTFCNIFLWDATRALLAEVPHWIERWRAGAHPIAVDASRAGNPADWRGPPSIVRQETNANELCDWLETHGPRFGWGKVDRPSAGAFSARGEPVVAAFKNPGGIGHVAILLPPAGSQLRIAQAGARNFYDEPLEHGFGNLPVSFFAHV